MKIEISMIMHLLEKIDTRIEKDLSMNIKSEVEQKKFLLEQRNDLVEILKRLYY